MYAYEELLNNSTSFAFIAVDFSEKYKYIYEEIIKPAVFDSGLTPIRSDQISSLSEQVHTQIRNLIKKSRVFIADISYIRQSSYGNVFLETGIAVAMEHQMILIAQEGEEIPFDVKGIRRIDYRPTDREKTKKELTSLLQRITAPSESILNKLFFSTVKENYVIFGYPSSAHMQTIYPTIDSHYGNRLRYMSSEASGIGQLAMALQRIARSNGEDSIHLSAVNGYSANEDVYSLGNIFVFGGPGANPHFLIAEKYAENYYLNALNIEHEITGDGKKRYYISKNREKYPKEQYSLHERSKDIGFLMRFKNPFARGATIMIAAGIRSYGTEGAIKLLVTPSIISKVDISLDGGTDGGFWALIEVDYEDNQLGEVNVIETQLLQVRDTK